MNAYSYVLNNPLSLTDPSGFFFSSLFRAIGRAIKAVARAIGRALKAIVRSAIGRAFLQILACMPPHGTVTCAPAAGALTLAAGGSIKDALIATAVSFAQMGVYNQIHVGLGQAGLSGAAGLVAKAAVHGVVGGAASVATGGSFESGFASGAVAGASGFLMESTPLGQVQGNAGVMLRTAVAALAGGTASVLSGGKFANGAITGAMAQLFNGEGLLSGGACAAAAAGAAGACAATAAAVASCPATGATCAAVPPAAEACSMGVGATIGVCAVAIGFAANDNQANVHANSAASMQGTELYYLINRATGIIDKIGITSYPEKRYPDAYLRAENVDYFAQAYYQWRYPAMLDENIRLTFYRFEHGQLPRLNRVDR